MSCLEVEPQIFHHLWFSTSTEVVELELLWMSRAKLCLLDKHLVKNLTESVEGVFHLCVTQRMKHGGLVIQRAWEGHGRNF